MATCERRHVLKGFGPELGHERCLMDFSNDIAERAFIDHPRGQFGNARRHVSRIVVLLPDGA